MIFLGFSLNYSVAAPYYSEKTYKSIPCKVFNKRMTLKKHFLDLVKNEEVEYNRENILNFDSIILNRLYNKEKFEKSYIPRLFVDIEYTKSFKNKKHISTKTATAYFKACLNQLNIFSTELYIDWGAQRRVVNYYQLGDQWYIIDFGMASYLWKWIKLGTDPELIKKFGNPEDYFYVPFETYVKKSPISSVFIHSHPLVWESKRFYFDDYIFKIKNSN